MSEETAKQLIEAMNRLADALARSGTVNHYHYSQPPTYIPNPVYPTYPWYTCGGTPGVTVWANNGAGMTAIGVAQ